MASRKKATGRVLSIPAGMALGVGVFALAALAMAAVLAWLIVTERAGEEAVGWGTMVILPVCAALGSGAAWRAVRHRRLLVSLGTSGCCYLALLAAGLLFGGLREGLAVTLVLTMLGGGISLIPALLGNKSGARRHKIPAYR